MLYAEYIVGVTAASGNNQLIPNISRVCCSMHDKTRFVLDRDRESTDIDKIKVLLIGDCGVSKTSLLQ